MPLSTLLFNDGTKIPLIFAAFSNNSLKSILFFLKSWNILKNKSKFGSESPIKNISNILLNGSGFEVTTGPPPIIIGAGSLSSLANIKRSREVNGISDFSKIHRIFLKSFSKWSENPIISNSFGNILFSKDLILFLEE